MSTMKILTFLGNAIVNSMKTSTLKINCVREEERDRGVNVGGELCRS